MWAIEGYCKENPSRDIGSVPIKYTHIITHVIFVCMRPNYMVIFVVEIGIPSVWTGDKLSKLDWDKGRPIEANEILYVYSPVFSPPLISLKPYTGDD